MRVLNKPHPAGRVSFRPRILFNSTAANLKLNKAPFFRIGDQVVPIFLSNAKRQRRT